MTRVTNQKTGGPSRPTGPGHRVKETWMGEDVETLADLLRPGLNAVCVGINPSPVSVAAGHYYQGPPGNDFSHGYARQACCHLTP